MAVAARRQVEIGLPIRPILVAARVQVDIARSVAGGGQ